jgi:formylglycine-generating enzyme required for sulfatase activity
MNQSVTLLSIPAGTFQMGTASGKGDEQPVHSVTLEAFHLGEAEVTQGQYLAVMGANPSFFHGDDSLPVEKVTWYEAVNFCNRLSDLCGLERCYNRQFHTCMFEKTGFRLPTEAEWEYACRAGTASPYSTGESGRSLMGAAWFDANSGKHTHPVRLKNPNPWNLYDMHGNVWEWCNDWYDSGYYRHSPSIHPKGPEDGYNRVLRGGSWNYFEYCCQSSYRAFHEPERRYNDIGFRIACSFLKADVLKFEIWD